MNSFLLRRSRTRALQPVWERLYRAALVGMNFWASELSETGELNALAYVARSLSMTRDAVIFDVGANVGEFTEACRSVFAGRCTVHAFEPSPRTFALLKARLEPIGDAGFHLHNIGFSDTVSDQTLYSSEPGSTIASLHRSRRPLRPFREELSETVRLTTLDAFCEKNQINRIDFLKLDIEGHELAALKGAQRMLRDGKIRFIQFEFGESNVASRTYLSDFNALLGEQFRIFRILPGGLTPWAYSGGRSEIFATMNYLCEFKGFSDLEA